MLFEHGQVKERRASNSSIISTSFPSKQATNWYKAEEIVGGLRSVDGHLTIMMYWLSGGGRNDVCLRGLSELRDDVGSYRLSKACPGLWRCQMAVAYLETWPFTEVKVEGKCIYIAHFM